MRSLNTTTRCHSVRSRRSPLLLSRQLSEVASDRLATRVPSWVERISGSRPRLPTRMTLLTLPAIASLPVSFWIDKGAALSPGQENVKGSKAVDTPCDVLACAPENGVGESQWMSATVSLRWWEPCASFLKHWRPETPSAWGALLSLGYRHTDRFGRV